jgi:hypothetical protein
MISIIILSAFIALLVVVIRKHDEFRVTRKAIINAPATTAFDYVNDMTKWQSWSPWAKMDPDAKISFEGPNSGMGASFSWDGKKTGQGIMTVVESLPVSLIRFRLEFFKPMKAVNTAEFTFTPEGDHTLVTWTMYGPQNFMGKFMSLFMNCEKMVGGQFDEGLADLNEITSAVR